MRFHTVFATALLVQLAATAPAAEPIDIGARRELMVDDYLIEGMSAGARLVMHRPTPREIAIVFDQPWEGNASGYPTVFRDGDLYRMYYRGHRYSIDGKSLRQAHKEVVCYAESRDGIKWTKPNLRRYDWEGSKENNIIWIGAGSHNFAPFKDENPDCESDARYKALGGTIRTGLLAFESPDGIRWSKVRDEPVYTEGAFDSLNVAFWDATRERYALYFRYFSGGDLGKGLRLIGAAHSSDFLNWSDQQPLSYPDSPPQQMYTNQIVPYPRAPHILVGFPTRYVARELTDHVRKLDPVPLRTRLTKILERAGSDLTDGLFMSSRDGLAFRRWDEAFLRPGPQHEGRWIYGDNYQCRGLVETRSRIPGGPNEISFYSSEGAWRAEGSRERRYTIRLDGFVSAQAPLSGGEVITKPIRFAGRTLRINYATSAAGSLRVELQDAAGKPYSGFALADCPELYGDAIEQVVAWKSGSDTGALAGKAVRVRFVLRDADLYAFRFEK